MRDINCNCKTFNAGDKLNSHTNCVCDLPASSACCHGGDVYTKRKMKYANKMIDFSANINPLGMQQEVKNAIIDNIDKYECYPDPLCRELRTKIAEVENTNKDNILCGNGAADIIFKLALGLKPKKALLLAPTFSEYEQALKTVDCKFKYYNIKEENDFNIKEEVLNCITNELDIMFVCNPNNPTGVVTKKALMEKILDKCKSRNVTLVVDECFIDFVENEENYSISSMIENYDNLVIIKAFTKIYAMAGIRLGYMMCSNNDIIKKANNSSQSWSVSTVASKCGVAALSLDGHIEKTKQLISENRDYLVKKLNEMGIKTYNSKTNYILFYYDDNMLVKKLEQYGLLIRDCSNYHNLIQGFYRIAVKSKEDNQYLIECLKKVITE